MILEQSGFSRPVPRTVLYKYAPFASAELILRFNQLKFTQPSALNDPFEFRTDIFDFTIKELSQIKKLTESEQLIERNFAFSYLKDQKNFPAFFEKFLTDYTDSYRIFCMSERYDIGKMWSHYANSHTGVCFGFQFPPKHYDSFFKVKYVKQPEEINFWEFGKYFFVPWMCTKGDEWEYEREVRVQELTNQNFYEFDKSWFKEIYFGKNMSEDNQSVILAYLELLGYTNVTAYKMIHEGRNSYNYIRKSL